MQKKKEISFNAGTLYEANKQLIKQHPGAELTAPELAQKQEQLKEWFKKIKYAMLLCHDIRYFTVFDLSDTQSSEFAAQETIGCLQDLQREILSIELQDDDVWEIWLDKDNPIALYLFDYSRGVIKC